MPNYICVTCGTQFAATDKPPASCPICDDERQYLGWNGQQWTTLEALRHDHHNAVQSEDPQLTSIITEPSFAIGQRALLVQSPSGNVLWDCVSLIDDATLQALQALGGVSAIAISHPHFYSSMVNWSHALGRVPIYVHADDRAFVMRLDPAIVFWDGDAHELSPGLMLVRCGGHFPGSTVLHWAAGAGGRGALLTSDTIYVASDRRYVSFMFSYPNLMPLPAHAVRHIADVVEPMAFDRIYSSWPGRVVASDAKAAVRRSADRYIRALGG
jgi:glyoxylase-like metal-dependent hydrolase (beta-lactamase superfamily II)